MVIIGYKKSQESKCKHLDQFIALVNFQGKELQSICIYQIWLTLGGESLWGWPNDVWGV